MEKAAKYLIFRTVLVVSILANLFLLGCATLEGRIKSGVYVNDIGLTKNTFFNDDRLGALIGDIKILDNSDIILSGTRGAMILSNTGKVVRSISFEIPASDRSKIPYKITNLPDGSLVFYNIINLRDFEGEIIKTFDGVPGFMTIKTADTNEDSLTDLFIVERLSYKKSELKLYDANAEFILLGNVSGKIYEITDEAYGTANEDVFVKFEPDKTYLISLRTKEYQGNRPVGFQFVDAEISMFNQEELVYSEVLWEECGAVQPLVTGTNQESLLVGCSSTIYEYTHN